MNNFLKYNWPSILWAAIILGICLMPGRDLPKVELINADKLAHFICYVLLALFTFYGWQKQNSFAWFHVNTFIKILFITSVYGFAVEIMQHVFTADRHFDLYDALANSIGAVAGCFVAPKLIARI